MKTPLPIVFLSVVFLIGACTGGRLNTAGRNADYSVIYLIHGDSDYLFHDMEGNALQADENILSRAIKAAEKYTAGETFIFYQKPDENYLWFFPEDDGEYYHFINGVKIKEGTYDRKSRAGDYGESLNIVKSRSVNDTGKVYILYYGHEIPAETRVYNESLPKKEFGIDYLAAFAEALGNRVETIVLSTCTNGTPYILKKLASVTDYVIASPTDLHLSYMNAYYPVKVTPPDSAANLFARKSFKRLTEEVVTETSIAVYDMKELTPYLREKDFPENRAKKINDCAETGMGSSVPGVTVFYKPPLFGDNENKQSHSGLGCYREEK